MRTINIVFKLKDGRRPHPLAADQIDILASEAAIIPQIGDMYSFDGAEFFKVIGRQWVARSDVNMLELILE